MALDLSIAATVVTLSIVLSGILIGLGRVLSSKKVEYFGMEELIQSIINAALLGAYGTIVAVATEISKELIDVPTCEAEDALANLSCVYQTLADNIYTLMGTSLDLQQIVSYYQSIVLEFPTFSIQPLSALYSVSDMLAGQIEYLQFLLMASELQVQLLSFFAPQLLTFFLPLGLVFRAFFSTRRLGGFLIAVSIGIYLLYPALILVFPVPELNETRDFMVNVTNNSLYAAYPVLDLNDSYGIGARIDNMSAGDFSGDLTLAIQHLTEATTALSILVIVAPIFSLLLTIIFIKEVTDIFGGEFFFAVGSL